jgi:hypothetical protein
MAERNQPGSSGAPHKRGRPQTKEAAFLVERAGAEIALTQLPAGPLAAEAGDGREDLATLLRDEEGAFGAGCIENQVARLGDSRLTTIQRQALAVEIGRVQGNRHLQRVAACLKQGERLLDPMPSKMDVSVQRKATSEGDQNVTPVAPYYVSFQNARPPSTPNHSLASPGPSQTGADRAGYTRARVRKRARIAWGHGPGREDGKIPFFARSVNVYFWLDPIEVFVSSDYAEGSCPYRVTLQHEMSHVRAFLRIFHSYRSAMVRALNSLSFPTENAPRWVDRGDLATLQASLGEPVAQAVRDVAGELVAAMRDDRTAKDSPSAYAAVYAQCPADQWNP